MSEMCQKLTRAALFDNLISATEQGERKRHPERLRCLEVDDKFDFHQLCNRQFRRRFAFENTAGVTAELAIHIGQIWPVTHQAAMQDELAICVDRGHPVTGSQRHELVAPADEGHIRAYDKCPGALLG